jgi:hypothetical protein
MPHLSVDESDKTGGRNQSSGMDSGRLSAAPHLSNRSALTVARPRHMGTSAPEQRSVWRKRWWCSMGFRLFSS